MLIRKVFSCANGLIKVNVYFKEIAKCAIIFRYKNEEEYTAIEMNGGENIPIRIIKKENNSIKELMNISSY